MKVKKYEYKSKSDVDKAIKKLSHFTEENGVEHPTHKNSVVLLGHIVKEKAEFNDEGEQTKAPVYAAKYSVDVLWHESVKPENDPEKKLDLENWKDDEIFLDGQGVNEFMGIKYQRDDKNEKPKKK